MFSKLNSYIQLLFAMGQLPWKLYHDIPANSIYIMDELGNNVNFCRTFNSANDTKSSAKTGGWTPAKTGDRTKAHEG